MLRAAAFGNGSGMAARGRFQDFARTYRAHTGESVQFIKSSDWKIGSGPIPIASGDQALLESCVFTELAGCGYFTKHPFGISRVRPASDGAVTIWLDATMGGFNKTYPLAAWAISRLLPYALGGDYASGIANLRVARVQGRDLELTLIGTDSRLVLRAAAGTWWKDELSALYRKTVESGHEPLWTDPKPVTFDVSQPDGYDEMQRRISWLGSGLLRRVALFHTATSAYYVNGWEGYDMLKFSFDFDARTGPGHGLFMDRLLNVRWGMPLKVEDSSCRCFSKRDIFGQCTFLLTHADMDTGALQLRFGYLQPGSINRREMLQRVGADPRWLTRVLPAA